MGQSGEVFQEGNVAGEDYLSFRIFQSPTVEISRGAADGQSESSPDQNQPRKKEEAISNRVASIIGSLETEEESSLYDGVTATESPVFYDSPSVVEQREISR